MAGVVGAVVLVVVVWWLTPARCPSCDWTDWSRESADLWECRRCGVWYDPLRGRWRHHLLSTRYPMPGLRGVLPTLGRQAWAHLQKRRRAP